MLRSEGTVEDRSGFRRSSVSQESNASLWDRIGIGLSGICMIHCLVLPIVLASLAVWPVMEEVHAWLHPVFAVLLVPTTIAAAWHGWRSHRDRPVIVVLAVGLCVVLTAGVLGHSVPGAFIETALTLTGSTILMVGHWRNWRLIRRHHVHNNHSIHRTFQSEALPQLAGEEACID